MPPGLLEVVPLLGQTEASFDLVNVSCSSVRAMGPLHFLEIVTSITNGSDFGLYRFQRQAYIVNRMWASIDLLSSESNQSSATLHWRGRLNSLYMPKTKSQPYSNLKMECRAVGTMPWRMIKDMRYSLVHMPFEASFSSLLNDTSNNHQLLVGSFFGSGPRIAPHAHLPLSLMTIPSTWTNVQRLLIRNPLSPRAWIPRPSI